jgi:nicotinamidase-related amidase
MDQSSEQNRSAGGGSPAGDDRISRRQILTAGIVAGTGVAFGEGRSGAQPDPAPAEKTARLPEGLVLDRKDTALVVTDPQNEVLSEKGLGWGMLGESVKENHTVENLARLFKAAKDQGFGVFISPHYMYPTDQAWQFGGTGERMMLEAKELWRAGPLSLTGLAGSGADWLERYKPFIEDGKTVVVSPHKVYGPQCNDLVLQLRKRRINKVVLAGMMANFCVESHLRELLEQGFEVAVVKDATAGPRHPTLGDGYKAALVNYGYLAQAVFTTDDAVKAMR